MDEIVIKAKWQGDDHTCLLMSDDIVLAEVRKQDKMFRAFVGMGSIDGCSESYSNSMESAKKFVECALDTTTETAVSP